MKALTNNNDPTDRVSFATLLLCLTLAVLGARSAQAEVELDWAGFGTFGAGVLDDDSINETNGLPHNLYDEDVRLDVDTRLGFQGTSYFNDSFSATLQVLADSAEEDELNIEWAYLSYDVTQQLKLRIGRMRRPIYALTDVLPVGYVYPWARPPLEVYSRDMQVYDEIDAIDVLYSFPAGDWIFTTEFYIGAASGEGQVARDEQGDYESKDDRGIVLLMEKDWLSLRLGYHRSTDLTIEPSEQLKGLYEVLETSGYGSVADDMRWENLEGEFYSMSAGIDYQNWLLIAEVVHLSVEGGAVPEEDSWYITGGKRFGPWTLHLTYAERDRESDLNFSQPIRNDAALIPPPFNAGLLALADGVDAVVDGLKIDQNSYTLGVRYDFDVPICIKAEYQYIEDNQFDLTNNLVSVVVDFLF